MVAAALKDDLSVSEIQHKNAELGTRVLGMTETVFTQLQEGKRLAAHTNWLLPQAEKVHRAMPREFGGGAIENIYQSVLQTLNTRYGNRTLLAGTSPSIDKPAFDAAGNFMGDGGEISVEIGRGLRGSLSIYPLKKRFWARVSSRESTF
jgi:hypothetical protein